jgi:hypothetical protein
MAAREQDAGIRRLAVREIKVGGHVVRWAASEDDSVDAIAVSGERANDTRIEWSSWRQLSQ